MIGSLRILWVCSGLDIMKNVIDVPCVFIKSTNSARGSGVFAARSFDEGEVVEVSPMLILEMNFDSLPELLKSYVFDWSSLTGGEADQQQGLIFGYGSMYNHDNPANMRYEADAHERVMRYIATQKIQQGDELTINYNAWGGAPVSDHENWFDERGMSPILSHQSSPQISHVASGANEPMLKILNCVSHPEAVKWACGQFKVQNAMLVSDNAWAATYHVSGPSGSAYLKILPPVARGSISRIALISKKIAGHVPEVIATDPHEGWILFADHGGQDLASGDDLIEVARSFAMIQAHAVRSAELQSGLEVFDINDAPQALMAFLTRPPTLGTAIHSSTGASYFIGEAQAIQYAALLKPRLHLLSSHLQAASELPKTLCHCDLQKRNVALKPNGQIVFFDWDEAVAGPAGVGLHGLFSCSTLPAILVAQWMASGRAGDSLPDLRLKAYVQALVDGNYATESALLAGIVGGIFAGQIRFIISFGDYPGQQHHADCANTLNKLLSDLLDLCDFLATQEPCAAIASAQDYGQRGEWHRAERLVQDVLARNPSDLDGLTLYCRTMYQLGNLEAAQKAAKTAFALAPKSVAARIAMAIIYLGKLNFSACTDLLQEVFEAEPENSHARELRELMGRAQTPISIREIAGQPQGLPCIRLSDQEKSSQQLSPDSLDLLLELFSRHGVVQIDNIFSLDLIGRIQDRFHGEYKDRFSDGGCSDVLQIGEKRYMLTMELDDLFGSEDLVASKILLPFIERVLGEECILSAYTAAVSLPGSTDQPVHKDHCSLFREHGWDSQIPSFALQLVVPLLPLNASTGTTRVFKGSQRVEADVAAQTPHQDPYVPLGSCLLIDYSVAHCGLSNRSDMVRPILNLVYSRGWFRDYKNYEVQPPLRFSKHYFGQASPAVRKLVGWREIELRLASQSP